MPEHDRPPFTLSDSAYNKIKWLVTLVLPAGGTLYFALTEIWGFPAGQQVLGTIIAVQAFLGVVLGLSSRVYTNSEARFGGEINIHHSEDKSVYSLELKDEPEKLQEKDEVTFKVNTLK